MSSNWPPKLVAKLRKDQVMHSLVLPFYGYLDQVEHFLTLFRDTKWESRNQAARYCSTLGCERRKITLSVSSLELDKNGPSFLKESVRTNRSHFFEFKFTHMIMSEQGMEQLEHFVSYLLDFASTNDQDIQKSLLMKIETINIGFGNNFEQNYQLVLEILDPVLPLVKFVYCKGYEMAKLTMLHKANANPDKPNLRFETFEIKDFKIVAPQFIETGEEQKMDFEEFIKHLEMNCVGEGIEISLPNFIKLCNKKLKNLVGRETFFKSMKVFETREHQEKFKADYYNLLKVLVAEISKLNQLTLSFLKEVTLDTISDIHEAMSSAGTNEVDNFKLIVKQESVPSFYDNIELFKAKFIKKSLEMTESITTKNCTIFLNNEQNRKILQIGEYYVVFDLTNISGVLCHEEMKIDSKIIDELEQQEGFQHAIVFHKSAIKSFNVNTFDFIPQAITIQPKWLKIAVDLKEWSTLENLVNVEIIEQIHEDAVIDLLVYDSTLNDNNRSFPHHEIETGCRSLDQVFISKEKKDAIQIIVKLFLIKGINSLQIADVLDYADSK